MISDEVEEQIVDWVHDNPLLYTRGSKEFKDTAKKTKMWKDKATELGLVAKHSKDLGEGPPYKIWKVHRSEVWSLSQGAE